VGSGVAGLIVHGQWWRVVTALTLHSDFMHVAGNAVAFIVFLTALGRWWVEDWPCSQPCWRERQAIC